MNTKNILLATTIVLAMVLGMGGVLAAEECKGDMNNDGLINFNDINSFRAVYDYATFLQEAHFPDLAATPLFWRADIDNDINWDNDDVNGFVALIVDDTLKVCRDYAPASPKSELECVRGDMNGDDSIDFDDINGFKMVFDNAAFFQANLPEWFCRANIDNDDNLDNEDINGFVCLIVNPSLTPSECAVQEVSTNEQSQFVRFLLDASLPPETQDVQVTLQDVITVEITPTLLDFGLVTTNVPKAGPLIHIDPTGSNVNVDVELSGVTTPLLNWLTVNSTAPVGNKATFICSGDPCVYTPVDWTTSLTVPTGTPPGLHSGVIAYTITGPHP